MSLIQKMRDKWKLKRERKGVGRLMPESNTAAPPVIETAWGQVSESARHRAALNMRADIGLRASIEKLLADQMFQGDIVRGVEESMRRYPEAYAHIQQAETE